MGQNITRTVLVLSDPVQLDCMTPCNGAETQKSTNQPTDTPTSVVNPRARYPRSKDMAKAIIHSHILVLSFVCAKYQMLSMVHKIKTNWSDIQMTSCLINTMLFQVIF